MVSNKKEQICELLKAIETGDPAAVSVVNEDKYIQHNPQTHEGSDGLAVLFKRLSKTSPGVNIVRVFEDGDFVFAHTEYDFATRNIGFEIFRFEDNQAVEHWDNIQLRKGPNSSGNNMVDGPTEVTDHKKTEYNRKIVLSFVNEVLIKRQLNKLNHYIKNNYIEHNPRIANGLSALQLALSTPASNSSASIQYNKNHRILAEGDFVLSVCEGTMNKIHTSFYDLYRVAEGKIAEHWDTTEKIPSQDEWKNKNGKF